MSNNDNDNAILVTAVEALEKFNKIQQDLNTAEKELKNVLEKIDVNISELLTVRKTIVSVLGPKAPEAVLKLVEELEEWVPPETADSPAETILDRIKGEATQTDDSLETETPTNNEEFETVSEDISFEVETEKVSKAEPVLDRSEDWDSFFNDLDLDDNVDEIEF